MKTKVKDSLRSCRRFLRAGEAVSALEYAILVGVIVAGVAAALLLFSADMKAGINAIGAKVKAPTGVEAPKLSP